MSIQEHLNKIRNAIYGREVRESIAKGIETAYDDASENGNANMEVKMARGTHINLNDRLNATDNKIDLTNNKIDLTNNKIDLTNNKIDLTNNKINATDNNLNTRIDNIIATPTTVSEQEIADARQGKASLGANLSTKADRLVVENKIINANFADATNWSFATADGSVVNNEMTFTASAKYGSCYQKQVENSIAGHKYYVACDVKATSDIVRLNLYKWAGGDSLGLKGHSGSGAHERLAFIATADTSEVISARVIDYRTSAWTAISIKQFMLVDLTAMYGAGNEPSLADFESMLQNQNNGSSFVENRLITSLIVGEPTINPPMDKSVFPIYVDKTGDVINVISRYNATQDLRVNLAPKGVNNIFNIYDLYKIENLTSKLSNDITLGTSMNVRTTDWLGPYVVWAEENRDGDMPESYHFTGGNHGYDGGTTGSATGRTTDIQLFVDGKKHNGYSDYAHFIDIYWSNRIQSAVTKKADGTGREVLQENYHAHFDGYKWLIECNIEALEEIYIIIYYGIQASIPSWNGLVFYHNSPTNRLWNDASIDSTSGTKTTDRVTLKKGTDYLEMAIDNTEGIGDRESLSTGDGCFVSGPKVYFNLIKNTTFLTGEVLSYAGHYRFYSK